MVLHLYLAANLTTIAENSANAVRDEPINILLESPAVVAAAASSREEDGRQSMKRQVDVTTSTRITTTDKITVSNTTLIEDTTKAICFITSEYADDVSIVDRLKEPVLVNRTRFRHFLFTNLADLKPLGWTQIVTNLTFTNNHIIASRYAKFLGWKFPQIQDECQVAIYLDGIYKTSDRTDIYEKIARQLDENPTDIPPEQRPGWMQYKHDLKRAGPLDELKAIIALQKDTEEHVQKTREWLYAQAPAGTTNATDWLANIPVYLNTWIAYKPSSPHFQRVTEDFWNIYSQGSITWRDQPIWAFFVHKHGMKPIPFPGRKRIYFKLQSRAEGFGGHTYVSNENTTEGTVLA